MKKIGLMLVAAAIFFVLEGSLRAAVIGNPTAANGWSTTSAISVRASHPGYADREWIYTINGKGLDAATGKLHVSAGPYGGPFVVMGVAAGTTNPRGGTINTPNDPNGYGNRWIEYSFDKIYNLERMDVWAYNENAGWVWSAFSVKDVYIQVSTTGGSNASEWTFVTAASLNADPANPTPATSHIAFQGIAAKYVVLSLRNGNEGTYINNLQINNLDFGLSEVRFFDTTYTGPTACGAEGTQYLEGDLNKDCYVNLLDIAKLAGEWLECTDPAKANCDVYWK